MIFYTEGDFDGYNFKEPVAFLNCYDFKYLFYIENFYDFKKSFTLFF